MIQLKRVYEQVSPGDGYRVLIDRLWPRGVSKERAQVDLWMKEIAPSDALRKWFGHDPQKWSVFTRKYKNELYKKEDLIRQLKDLKKQHKTLILLFGAKDIQHNQAIVLSEILS